MTKHENFNTDRFGSEFWNQEFLIGDEKNGIL